LRHAKKALGVQQGESWEMGERELVENSNATSVTHSGGTLGDRHLEGDELLLGAALDWRRLSQIQGLGVRQSVVTKSTTILRQGQPASSFFVLFDGWGLRYKQLGDGRRQILSFLLPGDPATLSSLLPRPLNHSVQMLPGSAVGEFDLDAVQRIASENSDLQSCVAAPYEQEFARTDELATNLGRRSAKERIAHLMLEFVTRLGLRGTVQDSSILMPLRQRHLADALGLTTIHVNRTLRALRDENLIDIRGGVLQILDRNRLVALANFDATYLTGGNPPD